jgi:hypothetical protein
VGLAGWFLYRWGTTLPAGSFQAPLALSWGPDSSPADPGAAQDATDPSSADSSSATSSYETNLLANESGSNLLAKNPKSSASGLFQFTQATWEGVGGSWGPDPTKAFGGLTPSAEEQQMRFDMLTQRNAAGLQSNGISITNAALYIAHFLGLGGALSVFFASPSTALASVVGSKVMAANPQLKGFTVADFISWAEARA